MNEYQQIVDRRFHQKVQARINAMALQAQAEAKRQVRQVAAPESSERIVLSTPNGPVYQVEKMMFAKGAHGLVPTQVTLPYLTILGGEVQ